MITRDNMKQEILTAIETKEFTPTQLDGKSHRKNISNLKKNKKVSQKKITELYDTLIFLRKENVEDVTSKVEDVTNKDVTSNFQEKIKTLELENKTLKKTIENFQEKIKTLEFENKVLKEKVEDVTSKDVTSKDVTSKVEDVTSKDVTSKVEDVTSKDVTSKVEDVTSKVEDVTSKVEDVTSKVEDVTSKNKIGKIGKYNIKQEIQLVKGVSYIRYYARFQQARIYLGKEYNPDVAIAKIKQYEDKHK